MMEVSPSQVNVILESSSNRLCNTFSERRNDVIGREDYYIAIIRFKLQVKLNRRIDITANSYPSPILYEYTSLHGITAG